MEAGKILKQAREEKKLSLHEIGMSLKINPKTLQAIEDGDIAKLPPKTFLRGFIKSYAQYLKLDPALVLQSESPVLKSTEPEQVAQALPVEAPPKPVPAPEDKPTPLAPLKTETSSDRTTKLDPLRASAAGPRKGVYVALIVGLLLTIGAIFGQVKKYQRESVVPKPEVPVSAPLPAPTPQPPVSAVPGDVTAESAPEKPVAAVQAAADLSATTPSTAAPQPAPVAPLAATAAAATPKAADNVEPAAKPQEVIIEALNNVHVIYSLGDGKVEQVDLSADEIHTFKSNTLIHLEISDGGSVNLILNGRDRGVPGKIGKPLVLNYPK